MIERTTRRGYQCLMLLNVGEILPNKIRCFRFGWNRMMTSIGFLIQMSEIFAISIDTEIRDSSIQGIRGREIVERRGEVRGFTLPLWMDVLHAVFAQKGKM